MFETLDMKMEQLGRNVAQGELGLQVADGKAKDIDLELKQFEQNLETEATDVNKMLAEELNKESPNDHIELNGVDQALMQDKINKKVAKLNGKFSEVAKMEQEMGQTQFDAAVIKRDLNNTLHGLSQGMQQIQTELKGTKS
jgi:inhibitor of KinA sporulation pathway (predicted exonuclease)